MKTIKTTFWTEGDNGQRIPLGVAGGIRIDGTAVTGEGPTQSTLDKVAVELVEVNRSNLVKPEFPDTSEWTDEQREKYKEELRQEALTPRNYQIEWTFKRSLWDVIKRRPKFRVMTFRGVQTPGLPLISNRKGSTKVTLGMEFEVAR